MKFLGSNDEHGRLKYVAARMLRAAGVVKPIGLDPSKLCLNFARHGTVSAEKWLSTASSTAYLLRSTLRQNGLQFDAFVYPSSPDDFFTRVAQQVGGGWSPLSFEVSDDGKPIFTGLVPVGKRVLLIGGLWSKTVEADGLYGLIASSCKREGFEVVGLTVLFDWRDSNSREDNQGFGFPISAAYTKSEMEKFYGDVGEAQPQYTLAFGAAGAL